MAGLGEQILNKIIDGAIDRALLPKRKSQADAIDKRIEHLDSVIAKLGSAESPNQPSTLHPSLPTKEETVAELKRRLARELYKAELDLAGGLRIGGKPCTCLDQKHTLMLEAAAEELIAEEPDNSIYREVIQWIRDNGHKLTVEAIESGTYDEEYPKMAAQFRDFRKRVTGTVAIDATKPSKTISLEEAKKLAAEEAAKEVEEKWHSQEKK